MRFFGSLWRLVASIFGIAQGATEIATDKMLTSSPEAIRSQFRKIQEDKKHDLEQMTNAVAELVNVRDMKAEKLTLANKRSNELQAKMDGAIAQYRSNQDERLKVAYAKFAEEHSKTEASIDELEQELAQHDQLVEQYKAKLKVLRDEISSLKQEEAETIADIVSAKKITELNSKLEGLSTDTQSKNLEAMRETRKRLKSVAKLSNDLADNEVLVAETKLLEAGVSSKHAAEFDRLVAFDKAFPKLEPAKDVIDITPAKSESAVDELFK